MSLQRIFAIYYRNKSLLAQKNEDYDTWMENSRQQHGRKSQHMTSSCFSSDLSFSKSVSNHLLVSFPSITLSLIPSCPLHLSLCPSFSCLLIGFSSLLLWKSVFFPCLIGFFSLPFSSSLEDSWTAAAAFIHLDARRHACFHSRFLKQHLKCEDHNNYEFAGF